jgi:hypothetical protein
VTRPVSLLLLLLWISNANAQHGVVINELMYAPKSPEPEWVELYNSSSDSIDLKGMHLSDKVKSFTLPQIVLSPKHFLVLCSDTVKLKGKYGLEGQLLIQGSLPTFNNDGDLITLKDSSGILIDSFIYSTSWGGSEGRSLERIDADTSSDSTNFSTSISDSGATPCTGNSVRRRDNDLSALSITLLSQNGTTASLGLVIQNKGKLPASSFHYSLHRKGSLIPITTGLLSEEIAPLLLDTIPFNWDNADLGITDLILVVDYSADEKRYNDTSSFQLVIPIPNGSCVINEFMTRPTSGSCQWIELANHSQSIINLKSSKAIIYQADTSLIITIDSLIIFPKGFGVISSSNKIFSSYSKLHSTDPIYIAGKTTSLGLSEDGGSITLVNGNASGIDTMFYDHTYYSTNLISPTGISLERKNIEGSGIDRSNWGSCVADDGATPLASNSLAFNDGNTIPSISAAITPNPFSPDGDGFEETTTIDLKLPIDDEAVFSIRICDSRGRIVRILSEHRRMVRSCSFEFDGRDDHGRILPIGLYTIVVEPISGAIQGIKKGIVIARK